MWLLFKGPNGHWVTPGQRSNTVFKSPRVSSDFKQGRSKLLLARGGGLKVSHTYSGGGGGGLRGGFKKKQWGFPISWLGGSSPTRFSIKKNIKVVLKHFILPQMHFKANLSSSIMTPPNPPHQSVSGLSGWGVQKGWIWWKNKLTLKFILGDLKPF